MPVLLKIQFITFITPDYKKNYRLAEPLLWYWWLICAEVWASLSHWWSASECSNHWSTLPSRSCARLLTHSLLPSVSASPDQLRRFLSSRQISTLFKWVLWTWTFLYCTFLASGLPRCDVLLLQPGMLCFIGVSLCNFMQELVDLSLPILASIFPGGPGLAGTRMFLCGFYWS